MKPHVICLMACSVDGRTLPSRWRPKGAAADHFEQIHEQIAGDAWLIGRVTGQEFAKGKPYPYQRKDIPARVMVRTPRCERLWRRARRSRQDRLGSFRYRRRSDRHGPCRDILGRAPCRPAQRRGVLIFAGKSELGLALVLDTLNRELGAKRLLLEGGGGTNGAFMRAGLVDELN